MVAMLTIAAIAFPASAQEASSRTATPKVSGKPVKKPHQRKSPKTHANFLGTDTAPYQNSLGMPLAKHLFSDQESIWTSPLRIRMPEATWLVPLGGLTAGLFATDTEFSRHLNNSPATLSHYGDFSNYGIGSMVGVGAGLYLWGLTTHDEHKRETGFLAGEAAIDSLAAATAIKYMTWRERPLTDNANGQFWDGGDSFPSDHAAVAWSVAGVIAHEYPGPLTKVFAYGLASAISVSRVKAKQHFPSDVLVGSALGWLIGQYVYKKHHSPELDGGAWDFPRMESRERSESQSKNMGSPYVPLDSWVYPVFDRLAALGYIHSDFEGMRPWTRLECARLVEEAGDHIADNPDSSAQANHLYAALRREFAGEINLLGGGNNRNIRLESVYTRVTGISGKPLTDGYHFGQTIINDYGRPYEEGFNNVTGFSGWASAGPFVGYVRGEYEHAPVTPAYSPQVENVIASVDLNPMQTPQAVPTVNQFRLLDSYVGINFENWQFSGGKESLWWGPNAGGSMMWSDNAEPLYMLRLNRVLPFKLPSVFGILGPVRVEMFLGQVAGHHFPPNPYMHGERLSFKPTRNWELGFSRTVMFAGQGHPFTTATFLRSIFKLPGGVSKGPDPGENQVSFDASYRMGDWASFYSTFMWDDAIRRTALNPGIYIPKIPGLPKLDLRLEVADTDVPNTGDSYGPGNGRSFYWKGDYHDFYTNDGNLIGSWVGRQGMGAQISSTYWLSPRSDIQLGLRHAKVSCAFIPGGGTINDGSLSGNFWIRSSFSLSGSVQYEKWDFPNLSPAKETDVSTSIEFTYWPQWRAH